MHRKFIPLIFLILIFPLAQASAEEPAARPSDVKEAFQKSLEKVKESGALASKGKGEKEDIVREKKQFLQRLTQVIDQKLAVLAKEQIPLRVLEEEIQKTEKRLGQFADEKKKIAEQKSFYDQKIKSIEQDLAIKKQLLDLSRGKESTLEKDIRDHEQKLEKTREETEYLKEHEQLLDLKIILVKDYHVLLHRKKGAQLRRILFTANPLKLSAKESAGLAAAFLLLVIAIFFKRKIPKFVLLSSILYYAGYWISSLAGYHLLARYVTKRLVLSIGLVIVAIAVYIVLTDLGRKFFIRPESLHKQAKRTGHPYFHIFRTLLAAGLFAATVYYVFEICGWQEAGRQFLWRACQYRFFAAGEMKLSLWLIFKVILIVWFFMIAARILDHFLYERVYPRTQFDETIRYAFSTMIKYAFIVIAGFTGLKILGVEVGALTVLAGTLGIGIGFGLQDLAKNFISGLVILIERPVKIGDYIEVGGLPGRVRSINARSTVVDTFDNISVVVPNSDFMSQNIVNWSYSDKITRMALKVGVAYGSNLELVKQSLLEAAKKHPKVLKHPAPTVSFEEFGDSSLDFVLFIWTDDPEDRRETKSEIYYRIDQIFRERNIEIPFPQRDIHIRSSEIIGREKGSNPFPN